MTERMPPQPCEGCTACCKIMGVAELDKPQNMWCVSCSIGKGCNNYETRPKGCADFNCAYALGMMGGDNLAMRPDTSKVVMSFTADGQFPVAHVDVSRPNAWREGPVGAWFSYMVDKLGKGIVVIGARRIAVGNWTKAEAENILNHPAV